MTMEFFGGIALGAIVVGACWWVHARSWAGVKSDLEDARQEILRLKNRL